MRIDREGPEAIPELRELWLALRDHHAQITPDWGPVRDDDDSWGRRRADYERWLAEPDAFVLVAREAPGGPPVGYAMVTVNAGSPTWAAVDRFGYVETLSVAADARGQGLGAALLDEVTAQLAAIGVDQIEITLVAANDGARRFYERQGYEPSFLTVRRRGSSPPPG